MGDVIEAEVLRLDFPNKGIASCVDPASGEALQIKVKGVLPGQRVRCRLTKSGNGRREARLMEVLRPGAIETEEPCPHFARCGGCAYQTLSAEAELALKEEQVRRLLDPVLEKYAAAGGCRGEGETPAAEKFPADGCARTVWEPALDSPRRFGYRNKMEFTWGDAEKDGPLALGLHRRGSMYDIESVTDCRIVDGDYRKILRAALAVYAPYHARGAIPFYHRMSGGGYLRHLLVRKAARTGEILVDLVTTSQTVPAKQSVYGEALAAFCGALLALDLDGRIVGILHTTNDARADAVRDEGTEILYGQDFFYEELQGLRFRITPFSFFQTNSLSAEVLYAKVRDYVRAALADEDRAAGRRKPVVYDLYSGTGTIAQMVAPVAERVAGIEIVPEAVEAAKVNAAENGIDNCLFFAGDVLRLVDDPAVTEAAGRPDLIILDPPREGVHPKALPKLLAFGVAHIIYVSCKPTSLAADLEVFLQNGYRVEKLCVINQFPGSGHCETVVCLSKGDVKSQKLRVEFSLEDMDTDGFKKGATYNAYGTGLKQSTVIDNMK